MVELEKTYLVRYLPEEMKGAEPVRILDVYIPETAEHAQLRLRQKGERYEITKKSPVREGDFSEQVETTIDLTPAEFSAMAKCSEKRVEKDRYKVEIDGRTAEIDVFRGRLEGLVLVDYEFEDAEAKAKFSTPDFALAEVTQEEFVAGGYLAGRAYEDLAARLEKFGYRPIKG